MNAVISFMWRRSPRLPRSILPGKRCLVCKIQAHHPCSASTYNIIWCRVSVVCIVGLSLVCIDIFSLQGLTSSWATQSCFGAAPELFNSAWLSKLEPHDQLGYQSWAIAKLSQALALTLAEGQQGHGGGNRKCLWKCEWEFWCFINTFFYDSLTCYGLGYSVHSVIATCFVCLNLDHEIIIIIHSTTSILVYNAIACIIWRATCGLSSACFWVLHYLSFAFPLVLLLLACWLLAEPGSSTVGFTKPPTMSVLNQEYVILYPPCPAGACEFW